MKRRDFLHATGAGLAGWAGAAALPGWARARNPRAEQPNIVLIVSDDQGWNDVGYHGSTIQTPNIDRLAAQGVELDRFYVTPICSPTRCGLLTGRSPIRYGRMRAVIPPWRRMGLPTDEVLLPEVLAEVGYARRACIGKWHLGHSDPKYHPLHRGFTSFYGHYNGAVDYFTHERDGELDWHEDFAPAYDQGYATDLLTERAVRFIGESARQPDPFFLYLAYNAPHTPLQVPEEALARYPQLSGARQAYAAMVSRMDHGIGRVLEALARGGVAENTLVVFLSDNGGNEQGGGSNDPLRGAKQTTFEGGIRVPALAHWPAGGLTGGRVVRAPLAYTDVFPTLLQAAGISSYRSPKPLDGLDVLNVMRGDARLPERFILFYWGQDGRTERGAVVGRRWKLVYDDGPAILDARLDAPAHLLLFDLQADPQEANNILEQHPDVAEDLLRRMQAFRRLRPTSGAIPPYREGRDGFVAPKEWDMERYPAAN